MNARGILAAAAVGALLVLAMPTRALGPVTAPVSACFVPGPTDCTEEIVQAIGAAAREIRVQAYGFSSPPVLGALAAARRRGADVQAVLDKTNDRRRSRAPYTGATYMANAGVPVWIDATSGIAHNKVIVIDGHLVVGGSLNYSANAQRKNVENVTFIDSPEVAGWFLRNWAARRDVSYRFEPQAYPAQDQ